MRKSHRFTELRSGQVFTSLLAHITRPGDLELRKDCSVVTKSGEEVPEGGLFSFLLFQEATSGLMRLPLVPWVHRAWELLGPDVVCLRESCMSGEEALASVSCSLTSASWAFAPNLPFSGVSSLLTCPLFTSCTVCREPARRRESYGSGTFSALPRDGKGLLRDLQGCKMRQDPMQSASTLFCDDGSRCMQDVSHKA